MIAAFYFKRRPSLGNPDEDRKSALVMDPATPPPETLSIFLDCDRSYRKLEMGLVLVLA